MHLKSRFCLHFEKRMSCTNLIFLAVAVSSVVGSGKKVSTVYLVVTGTQTGIAACCLMRACKNH